MNRCLILGASGFLGSCLYRSLKNKGYEAFGTYFDNKNNDELLYLNLKAAESIKKIIKEIKPDVIIHTGGITNTEYCEENKDEALLVNVVATSNLVNMYSGKIVYFSTDYVFDGEMGRYDENSKTNPIN